MTYICRPPRSGSLAPQTNSDTPDAQVFEEGEEADPYDPTSNMVKLRYTSKDFVLKGMSGIMREAIIYGQGDRVAEFWKEVCDLAEEDGCEVWEWVRGGNLDMYYERADLSEASNAR